jgi:asparagine synthase (glutamine-hydrolysing)
MTALAGFCGWDRGEDAGARCRRMLDAQRLYGPDKEAVWEGGGVAIGRRLFRILPEDLYDMGPVIGHGGSSALVADIRIDNRPELCRALGIAGDEARLLPDAALLMRCWEKWEEEALQRLIGDFAFALWEGSKRRLVLARDYIGNRPLHFSRTGTMLAFASMPKGLHALPEVPRAPDLAFAADFTALLPEAPDRSFFRGVERVMPGHMLVATQGGVVSTRYWRPDVSPLHLRSPGEYEEAMREHLDAAVAAQLRGAGKAAASHLSAGLDSTAVAATAARLMAPAGQRLVAYTAAPRAGYEYQGLGRVIADEAPLAASVAALHPNIEHIVVRNDRQSPGERLDRNFFLYDRPVLNLCNLVWSDAINDAVKARKLAVLLTGSHGNMSISYQGMTLLPNLLARGRLISLARMSVGLASNGVRWGTMAAQTLGPFLPRRAWKTISRLRGKGSDLLDHSAISQATVDQLDLPGRARGSNLDFSYRPRRDGVALRLWVIGRTDPGNYNKGSLGGWGIDRRDPTSDRRLLEFCLRVPDEQYMHGGVPRSLIRRALTDRLPPAVLGQHLKGYQSPDWHEGLCAGADMLREEVGRIAAVPEASGLLDTERMARLLREMPTEAWHRDDNTRQYRLALLRGISVGHFIRKAVGSNQ